MVQPPSELRQFSSLLEIVKALRGPDGCPWDKEQTHRSLTPFAVEEAFELAEAIEADSSADLKLGEAFKPQGPRERLGGIDSKNFESDVIVSELGDLLLQVALHSEIGRQSGRFTIEDVLESINSKMVRRHPHVFADSSPKPETSKDVLVNWAQIKATEKKSKPAPSDRFDIPPAMPALARSQKIGDKCKRLKFDWSIAEEVLAKVDEEISELKDEINAEKRDASRLEHEIGDVLFSVAQLARHLDLEAEQCLRTANRRFETRFFKMREQIAASGMDYESLSTQELEQAWQLVKISLSNHG